MKMKIENRSESKMEMNSRLRFDFRIEMNPGWK